MREARLVVDLALREREFDLAVGATKALLMALLADKRVVEARGEPLTS